VSTGQPLVYVIREAGDPFDARHIDTAPDESRHGYDTVALIPVTQIGFDRLGKIAPGHTPDSRLNDGNIYFPVYAQVFQMLFVDY
jgi:hypothetical protein